MQRGGIENGKESASKFPAVLFLYLSLSPRIQLTFSFALFTVLLLLCT